MTQAALATTEQVQHIGNNHSSVAEEVVEDAVQATAAEGAAQVEQDVDPVPASDAEPQQTNPHGSYLAILVLMTGVFLCVIAFSNRLMSPWLYVDEYVTRIANTLVDGRNFGVHDLNVDIRGIRRAQIAAMPEMPDIMLLGASHWQEAHAELTPGWDLYNAHVHRDYYDDYLAMVEVLLRNNKMPNHLIIAIRDSTFTSPQNRTDALWHPFIPEYRGMEKRLGLEPRAWHHDIHFNTLLDLFSVPLGLEAMKRWAAKDEVPGPTSDVTMESLDVLLADGSIQWSKEHLAMFTFERTLQESLAMADIVLNKEHEISEAGVAALSKLLALLNDMGVEVTLVHPPFNPSFYAMIEGTPYERHLQEVHAVTHSLADQYGMGVASSFDPRDVGCTADMYIDSEHGRPACLKRVLGQITQVIAANRDPYGAQQQGYATNPAPLYDYTAAHTSAAAGTGIGKAAAAVYIPAGAAGAAVIADATPAKAGTHPDNGQTVPAFVQADTSPAVSSTAIALPIKERPPEPYRYSANGAYRVQLLSGGSESGARRQSERLSREFAALLNGEKLGVEPASISAGKTVYRVRTAALEDRSAANALCLSFKALRQDCLVVKVK